MEKEPHPHAALIDSVPRNCLKERFSLTRQNIHHWRTKGVPLAKRYAFMRLAIDNGIAVPQSYIDSMEADA